MEQGTELCFIFRNNTAVLIFNNGIFGNFRIKTGFDDNGFCTAVNNVAAGKYHIFSTGKRYHIFKDSLSVFFNRNHIAGKGKLVATE